MEVSLTGVATILMVVAIVWVGWKQIGQLRNQLITQLKMSEEQTRTQLQTSHEQMRTIVQRSQAALLPSLDTRFDSREMEEARTLEEKCLQRLGKNVEHCPEVLLKANYEVILLNK